jgi:hypothetical protein
MATMCAILYTGNMLGMILYGSVVTNPDDHHGFVIYTILSGIPITAFAGAFGYISIADIEEIHGKQYAYEEVSPSGGGGVTRKMSKVMIFWTVILSILVAGAIYFWTAALVAITASHREMIPLGVVAVVYTILLIIAAFRCIHEYMRR